MLIETCMVKEFQNGTAKIWCRFTENDMYDVVYDAMYMYISTSINKHEIKSSGTLNGLICF